MLAAWQWLVLIPRMVAPAWRRQMQVAALQLDLADTRLAKIIERCGAVYTPPLSPNVDPLKDVTAQIAEIRAGLTSYSDALGGRGTTLEDQIAEIKRAAAALDAAGIILDTDPRRTAGSGGGLILDHFNSVPAAIQQRNPNARPASFVGGRIRSLDDAIAPAADGVLMTFEAGAASPFPVLRHTWEGAYWEILEISPQAIDL
eukprot:gene11433-14548_t